MMKCQQILIVAIVSFISLHIEAQDFIYKKNGDTIISKVLETLPKSISYQIPGQTSNTVYYLSKSVIDSIIYQDGIIKRFEDILPEPAVYSGIDRLHNHHLVGIDLAGLLIYKNYTFSYEFLPGKATWGFKVSYMQKNNPPIGYHYNNRFDLANSANWKLSLGTNIYFFAPRTFRFGTGLNYVFGEYPTDWTYNYTSGEQTWDRNLTSRHGFKGLSFTGLGFYNITKYFAVNIGADVPINIKPKSTVSFHMEALLNF